MTVKTTQQKHNYKFTPHPSLVGKPIRVTDAAEKYGIEQRTISGWAQKGLVTVLQQRRKLLVLDEASVAHAVAIFKTERENSNPYRAGWVLRRAILGTS